MGFSGGVKAYMCSEGFSMFPRHTYSVLLWDNLPCVKPKLTLVATSARIVCRTNLLLRAGASRDLCTLQAIR